jgi:hypothetical protein
MIGSEDNHRHGLSVPHAISIFVACVAFILALLAFLPDP